MRLPTTALFTLRDHGPLPIARLVARAANAKSTMERHQCTFYIGEVALKLAATVRVALVGSPDAALATALQKLPRATLGTWQEILRLADRPLPDGTRLTGVAAGPATASLLDALVAEDLSTKEAAANARRAGWLGLFDAFIGYRNQIIGHGGLRESAFYAAWTDRFASALAELFASDRILAGHVLVGPVRTEDGDRQWQILQGTSPLPWDPQARTGRETVVDGGLYFASGDRVMPVPPLARRIVDDSVGFLHDARARRGEIKRVEYLDYVTGRVIEDDAAREPLGALIANVPEVTDTVATPLVLAPGGTVGDFEIVDELGRGGQGTVFRARQTSMGRVVALKVLHPDLASDPIVKRRFEIEISALVRTDHPNIVKVFVVGEDRGASFYAMELIDGKDLAQPGALDGARDWRRFAELFAGAADAVQHLHARSIVHRDLKPGNLMLANEGTRLVVTDLGLAHLGDGSALTRDRSMLGTLRAMAPEQLSKTPAATAPAVDVFGLGVAMFEVATGTAMRPGDNDAVVAAQINQVPPRADTVRPAVPRALADVIARCLAANPAERFATASALATALRTLAEQPRATPIEAPPARARPVAAIAAGAVVVLGIAGVAIWRLAGSSSTTPPKVPAIDAAVAKAPEPDASSEEPKMTPPAMIAIPAGDVQLGNDPRDVTSCAKDDDRCSEDVVRLSLANHRRTVHLARFAIDEHEATWADVVGLIADEPLTFDPNTRLVSTKSMPLAIANDPSTNLHWNPRTKTLSTVDAKRSKLPAVGVTQVGAQQLCAWRGSRLPTADEWERAARGLHLRRYPWGNDEPTCGHANYGATAVQPACPDATIGAFDRPDLQDISEDRVHDLAGNVSEWVSGDPDAPRRGGAYDGYAADLFAGARFPAGDIAYANVGFRCVVSL